MNFLRPYLCAALFATLGIPLAACAQGAESRLEKFKETGEVTVGIRQQSLPFSYIAATDQPIGYTIDICKAIVERIQRELPQKTLKIKYLAVTPQTRIPLLTNGTIDMECASSTNTLERQQQVGFSDTVFVTGTKLLVQKSSGIRSYRDLKDKTLAILVGSNNERAVKALGDAQKLNIRFVVARDHAEASLMVQTGRANAYAMDDVILYGIKASANNPSQLDVVGEFLSREPYAVMLPKGDARLKGLADATIVEMSANGSLQKLYRQWFETPVPPRGVNLQLAPSEDLLKLWHTPDDHGV